MLGKWSYLCVYQNLLKNVLALSCLLILERLIQVLFKVSGFCLPVLYMVSATLSVQGLRALVRSQVTPLGVILDPPGNPAE
jgi:hypothetical protein